MDGLQAADEDERSCGSLYIEQLNTYKTLKDPTHRWARRGLLHLIRDRLLGLSQAGAEPKLGQAIDQQAQYHDEAQRHDALRLFHKDGGSQKQRIFQKAKAPLRATLFFVGRHELLVGEDR